MEKSDNRGIAITRNWLDISKSGGRSFEIETIRQLLERGEETMLTREEVMQRTLDYFNACIDRVEDEDSGEIISTWVRNPTKSGLALALGIDRLTLQTYINNERTNQRRFNANNPNANRIIASEDFDILRRAYSLIEEFYESKLGDNRNNAGVIFWLNNSNNKKWSNEQEFKFKNEENEERYANIDELPVLGDWRGIKSRNDNGFEIPNLNDGNDTP